MNGDKSNDSIIKRDKPTATLRGFKGGDLAGVIQKIEEGYFDDLGVNAIWMTPIWEQIHDGVDEGTGYTYGFHGYWAKDWTTTDPSYGTPEEFQQLVDIAHEHGIRVLMDVVLNHTGPVTDQDPQWPEEWVRTGPTCTYQDQSTAVTCTLTDNLPDIKTESEEEVDLPPSLVQKWKNENRYDKEIAELDAFFQQSGLKRTPTNYIIKWLTDYARETGIDGYRVDTVKHVEEEVWETLNTQAQLAYNQWKDSNKAKVMHDDDFFIIGELYGYQVESGREFYFSSGSVDYFDYGYDGMINFGFKREANMPYDMLFERYAQYRDSLIADGDEPVAFMNYVSSHDDGQPFDPTRDRAFEAGTKLLLAPGMSQIYYGDETARRLDVEAEGDAKLRSMMNWETMDKEVLSHWQKLGKFRHDHPAVGAGKHTKMVYDGEGTLAMRSYTTGDFEENVVIGAGLPDGEITIQMPAQLADAAQVRNVYTGKTVEVKGGTATLIVENGVILIERI